jgi:hypothetical protein
MDCVGSLDACKTRGAILVIRLTALQVRERNPHVFSEGPNISRRHWDFSDETPAALWRATQSRPAGTILVERREATSSLSSGSESD